MLPAPSCTAFSSRLPGAGQGTLGAAAKSETVQQQPTAVAAAGGSPNHGPDYHRTLPFASLNLFRLVETSGAGCRGSQPLAHVRMLWRQRRGRPASANFLALSLHAFWRPRGRAQRAGRPPCAAQARLLPCSCRSLQRCAATALPCSQPVIHSDAQEGPATTRRDTLAWGPPRRHPGGGGTPVTGWHRGERVASSVCSPCRTFYVPLPRPFLPLFPAQLSAATRSAPWVVHWLPSASPRRHPGGGGTPVTCWRWGDPASP